MLRQSTMMRKLLADCGHSEASNFADKDGRQAVPGSLSIFKEQRPVVHDDSLSHVIVFSHCGVVVVSSAAPLSAMIASSGMC